MLILTLVLARHASPYSEAGLCLPGSVSTRLRRLGLEGEFACSFSLSHHADFVTHPQLLRNDASKRLPLDMLLQHPWLTKFEPQVYARAKKAGYLKDTPAHKRPPAPSTPILFERR